MLVEHGRVVAQTSDGREWSFTPSFKNISTLGKPHDIVSIYAGLHGQDAAIEAAYVLACLCDQENALEVSGWRDEAGWHDGLMPVTEKILIARHLMQHGIIGTAKPSKGDGQFSDRFDAAEYITAARVHLGLSVEEAENLSMTEFQHLLEMKYPSKEKERDVPSREEYDAAMAHFEALRAGVKH